MRGTTVCGCFIAPPSYIDPTCEIHSEPTPPRRAAMATKEFDSVTGEHICHDQGEGHCWICGRHGGGSMIEFVRESNRIEGITREPTDAEVNAHERFMALESVNMEDVEAFVSVVAGARLRSEPGMNVRVGNHLPPPGGPDISQRLIQLLFRVNEGSTRTPWQAHIEYETLHPFMDGNGRSGRALWLWMMYKRGMYRLADLGFLHAFYYQTLDSNEGMNMSNNES